MNFDKPAPGKYCDNPGRYFDNMYYNSIFEALDKEDTTKLKNIMEMGYMTYDCFINAALQWNNRPKNVKYLLYLYRYSNIHNRLADKYGEKFDFHKSFEAINKCYRDIGNYEMGLFLAQYIKYFEPDYEIIYSSEPAYYKGDGDLYNKIQKEAVAPENFNLILTQMFAKGPLVSIV